MGVLPTSVEVDGLVYSLQERPTLSWPLVRQARAQLLLDLGVRTLQRDDQLTTRLLQQAADNAKTVLNVRLEHLVFTLQRVYSRSRVHLGLLLRAAHASAHAALRKYEHEHEHEHEQSSLLRPSDINGIDGNAGLLVPAATIERTEEIARLVGDAAGLSYTELQRCTDAAVEGADAARAASADGAQRVREEKGLLTDIRAVGMRAAAAHSAALQRLAAAARDGMRAAQCERRAARHALFAHGARLVVDAVTRAFSLTPPCPDSGGQKQTWVLRTSAMAADVAAARAARDAQREKRAVADTSAQLVAQVDAAASTARCAARSVAAARTRVAAFRHRGTAASNAAAALAAFSAVAMRSASLAGQLYVIARQIYNDTTRAAAIISTTEATLQTGPVVDNNGRHSDRALSFESARLIVVSRARWAALADVCAELSYASRAGSDVTVPGLWYGSSQTDPGLSIADAAKLLGDILYQLKMDASKQEQLLYAR